MNTAAQQDIDSGKGEVVTPGEPVDHVDAVDGQSAGHTIEPEAEPQPGDTVAEKPAGVSRDEIYNRASELRDAETNEALAGMTATERAHYERMIAEASGVTEEEQDPFDGEGNVREGWVDPNQPIEEQPAPAQTIAEEQPQTVDSNDEMVTITVYGMQQDVPRAEVDAVGGTAAYQKIVAADEKMKRASTYEASVRALDQEVSERLKALQEQEQGQLQATSTTADPELPPTGVQGETIDVQTAAEKLVGAMYTGDREAAVKEASEVLASLQQDAKRVAQAQVQQPGAQGPSPEEQQIAIERAAAAERERSDANHVFVTEFSDLQSQVLRDATYSMVQKVAAEPIMYGRPLAEVTREAGMRVRSDVFGTQAPNPTPSPTPNVHPPANTAPDLATRMALKKRTVVQPLIPASGRHADTPETEQKVESNSEYIARMRRESRGQY